MKFLTKQFVPFVFALVLLQLTSCRKAYDYIKHDPDADYKLCNIQKITSPLGEAVFYYNEDGDPDSIITTNPQDEFYNVQFRYDKLHRLTDYIQYYGNGFFANWHKYSYNDDNQIALEQNYGFGPMGAQLTTWDVYYEVSYKYDAKGRIKKSVFKDTTLPGSPVIIPTSYDYDNRGNLIKPGVVYDKQTNPNHTNKVWMFLDKDYSVNNPVSAIRYNWGKLPVAFGKVNGYLIGYSLSNALIDYSCN